MKKKSVVERSPDVADRMPSQDDMRRWIAMMVEAEGKTPGAPAKATEEEISTALTMVRRSMKLYGTLMPPRGERVTVAVKVCPHCGEEKPAKDFGFKTRPDGVRDLQPWCNACRSSKDAHPRKYGTR